MWHLPDLYEHFEACGVQTNLFATSWFVTLLSDGGMLPDDEVELRSSSVPSVVRAAGRRVCAVTFVLPARSSAFRCLRVLPALNARLFFAHAHPPISK